MFDGVFGEDVEEDSMPVFSRWLSFSRFWPAVRKFFTAAPLNERRETGEKVSGFCGIDVVVNSQSPKILKSKLLLSGCNDNAS